MLPDAYIARYLGDPLVSIRFLEHSTLFAISMLCILGWVKADQRLPSCVCARIEAGLCWVARILRLCGTHDAGCFWMIRYGSK
eukprot:4734780-Amphidinium_carterae.2